MEIKFYRKPHIDEIHKQPPYTRDVFDYIIRENIRNQLFRTYKQIIDDLSWKVGFRKESYKENHIKKAFTFLRENGYILTMKERDGVNIRLMDINTQNGAVKSLKSYCKEVEVIFDYFYESLPKTMQPKTNQLKNDWKDAIDKCHRIDGYSFKKINNIVKTYREDSFWKKNFLSPIKLRLFNREKIKFIDVFWLQIDQEKDPTNESIESLKIEKVFIKLDTLRIQYPDYSDSQRFTMLEKQYGFKKEILIKAITEIGIENLTGDFSENILEEIKGE